MTGPDARPPDDREHRRPAQCPQARSGEPTHPPVAAALLMIGVALLLLVISVLEVR